MISSALASHKGLWCKVSQQNLDYRTLYQHHDRSASSYKIVRVVYMPRLPEDPLAMRLCSPFAAAVPSQDDSPEEPATQTCAGTSTSPQRI